MLLNRRAMLTLGANRIRGFCLGEDGPTTVEYAVMLALIVVMCLRLILRTGRRSRRTFRRVKRAIRDAR